MSVCVVLPCSWPPTPPPPTSWRSLLPFVPLQPHSRASTRINSRFLRKIAAKQFLIVFPPFLPSFLPFFIFLSYHTPPHAELTRWGIQPPPTNHRSLHLSICRSHTMHGLRSNQKKSCCLQEHEGTVQKKKAPNFHAGLIGLKPLDIIPLQKHAFSNQSLKKKKWILIIINLGNDSGRAHHLQARKPSISRPSLPPPPPFSPIMLLTIHQGSFVK